MGLLEEVKAWQTRPLDPVYQILYIDALVVKVRDGAHVVNKAAHLVLGVDTDGVKHVLGIWVQSAEGAKFWLGVLTDLRNRGVTEVLIACCDGTAVTAWRACRRRSRRCGPRPWCRSAWCT